MSKFWVSVVPTTAGCDTRYACFYIYAPIECSRYSRAPHLPNPKTQATSRILLACRSPGPRFACLIGKARIFA